ncbi:hypothetical protein ACFYXH_31885 [Streptomyces sp. NPDC002730]
MVDARAVRTGWVLPVGTSVLVELFACLPAVGAWLGTVFAG